MKNENVIILEVLPVGKNSRVRCRCRVCGSEFEMWRSHYYRGSTACKCRLVKVKRLYSVYSNMKTRCLNDHTPTFKNYGGRGIGICDEWLRDYHAFEEWALSNGYEDGLTIDRIDVNGDYSPDNCRWVTPEQQQRNKRNTRWVEGTSLRNYCLEHGLRYKVVHQYSTRHSDIPIEDVVRRFREALEGNGDVN